MSCRPLINGLYFNYIMSQKLLAVMQVHVSSALVSSDASSRVAQPQQCWLQSDVVHQKLSQIEQKWIQIPKLFFEELEINDLKKHPRNIIKLLLLKQLDPILSKACVKDVKEQA